MSVYINYYINSKQNSGSIFWLAVYCHIVRRYLLRMEVHKSCFFVTCSLLHFLCKYMEVPCLFGTRRSRTAFAKARHFVTLDVVEVGQTWRSRRQSVWTFFPLPTAEKLSCTPVLATLLIIRAPSCWKFSVCIRFVFVLAVSQEWKVTEWKVLLLNRPGSSLILFDILMFHDP
jgi:hypothetical protein